MPAWAPVQETVWAQAWAPVPATERAPGWALAWESARESARALARKSRARSVGVSLSRRVERNAATQIAGRLYTSALAAIITAVVLPRRLTPYDFGIFAFYLSLHQMLQNVFDFGANTIVIREASRHRDAAGRLIGMLIGIKGSIAFLAMLGIVGVAWVFEGPGDRFVLLALAAVPMLFHAPAGAGTIFHVDMAFKWSTLASVLGQSSWLIGTLALALAGVERPAPYLIAFGLGTVVNGCLNYGWSRRFVEITYDARRSDYWRLWKEAWPAGVSMTMASIYFFIDTAMLRPMQGEVAVARYSVAYRLMTFVLMVPVLFSNVLFPVFSRLWALGEGSLRPFFQRSLRVLMALGFTVLATVPLIAEQIMGVVYEPEYGVSAPVLMILSVAIACVFAAYPHVLLLLASGHQRVMMVISTLGVGLNVGMNLWAIRRFGIAGAAWTTVATEAFVLVAAALCGWRLTGLRLDITSCVRPIVCAAGGGLALAATLRLAPDLADGWCVLAGLAAAALSVLAAGILPLDLGTEEGAPTDRGDRPTEDAG